MFAKEPHIKPLSNLKNSDRKKLQATIKSKINENYSLPTPVIKQTSFQVQNLAGFIYTDETNKPIWFKKKFEDQLYPTIYNLWKFQEQLLPIILTHDFVIEEHILGGANLMLPGTVPPFDSRIKKGTVVGIASTKEPLVVKAVGVAEMDLYGITHVIGTKGIAVRVVHYLDDGLFKAFKVDIDPPVFEHIDIGSSNREDEVDSSTNIESEGEEEEGEEEEAEEEEEKEGRNENDEEVEELAETLDHLSCEDVDHMLLRAVKYTIKFDSKVTLPMVASTFISNHVLKNLPDVDTSVVNLKKSSWKKATKFLKYLEDEGYIKLKGKNDNFTVISIDKNHKSLENMEPYKTLASSVKKSTATENSNSAKKKNSAYSGENLYKPMSSAQKLIIETTGDVPKQYYTQQELKKILDSYISQKKLIDPNNKSLVKFDDTLFKMSNKSTQNGGINSISRALLLSPTFLSKNFNTYHQIYKPDGSPLLKSPEKGTIPNIEIVTEKKIGRKIITRVSNFEMFKIDDEELAAALRKKCSGSTTIGESKTLKTKEVQVQGPHGAIAISILNDYGIPTKWISFENKVKPKQKKKI